MSPVLLHTATANGFQMVTSGAQSKAVSDWAITSLEVRDNINHNLAASDGPRFPQDFVSSISLAAVHFNNFLCVW